VTAAVFPSFDDFYAAVHGGRSPFPWQSDLAVEVAEKGWPEAIGVETGLGKTATIDIAVWALARQHAVPAAQRTAATRIWYVVNRRLLVDAAYEHGLKLQELLADPSAVLEAKDCGPVHVAAVQAVAEALASMAAMGSDHGPLHVTRLRGSVKTGARVPDPSQPALLFATVPMFASRWFFQGYGVSTLMRPVDAALAGIDSLVLLDESHLAAPLRALEGPAAECDVGDPSAVLPAARARPRLVELTATGDPTRDTFKLGPKDFENEFVQQRLQAAKPTRLVATSQRRLTAQLASEVVALLASAAPVSRAAVVFVNTAARARQVHDEVVALLGKRELDADVELLTGRVRDREGDIIRRRLLDPLQGASAGRPDGGRDRPLVVVATQTLEVGADLDFDLLVTETAGTRALVQRFGRLNRLGARNVQARAVICHPEDESSWPVYGEEPALVWERLTAHAPDALDLGPARIGALLGPPRDLPPEAAELLPVHLWEWAKTTAPPPDMAPIEPFVDGFAENTARVAVAWRAYLPDPEEDDVESARLWPPLRASETIELPLSEVRTVLAEEEVRRVVDGAVVERVRVERLRPGDHVVLDVGRGLTDVHGWNPASTQSVLDVSALESGVLVLDGRHAVLTNLLDGVDERLRQLHRQVVEPEDDASPAERAADLADLLSCLRDATPRPGLLVGECQALLDGLEPRLRVEPGLPPHLRARRLPRDSAVVAADVFDELSFLAESVELDQHLGTVSELAGRVVGALGVPADLADVVGRAGALHDLGKVDPRFQRWLDPEATSPDRMLAKSSSDASQRTAARIASGWPSGGRHELLSARLVEAAIAADGPLTADDDLLVHLVITHHGYGRPSVQVVSDPTRSTMTGRVSDRSITAAGDLAEHDWAQPARFRRLCERYGYWGLALLEAAVRQADHAASSQHGRRAAATGSADLSRVRGAAALEVV
jgi:CRISPR-associated endonuclease/helicase Cas3